MKRWFYCKFPPQLFKTKEQVLENIQTKEALLVDADLPIVFLPKQKSHELDWEVDTFRFNIPYNATTEKVLPKEALKKYFQYQKPLIFSCGSGVTACINMIAYELVSDNLKQFMMDLGPNGDKRKITNWEIENWIMTKTGNNKLDNPVWHSLSENHKEYGITYDDSVFYA
jgi:hypothetical protein